MTRRLKVAVVTIPLPLSRAADRALRSLARYTTIAFTSKNARIHFNDVLSKRKIALPKKIQIIQVGPRADLLTHSIKGARILFPRSARAPGDILQQLRAQGAIVRSIPLYTTRVIPLTKKERINLQTQKISSLYFRSASGVTGFLGQLRGTLRAQALRLPVHTIGETTAEAARKAGFIDVQVT
jgi:uroporphyrinogen-III synthase